jgi:hypothetical protein
MNSIPAPLKGKAAKAKKRENPRKKHQFFVFLMEFS